MELAIYLIIYILGYIFAYNQHVINDYELDGKERTNKDVILTASCSLLSWIWFLFAYLSYRGDDIEKWLEKKKKRPNRYSKETRDFLRYMIDHSDFTFKEDESRMNYGHIGNLLYRDEVAVVIFPKSFYVHNKDISINTNTLKIIQTIQSELKELKFENLKPQLLYSDDQRRT